MFFRKKKTEIAKFVDHVVANPEHMVIGPKMMAKTSFDGKVIMIILGDYQNLPPESLRRIFKEARFKI